MDFIRARKSLFDRSSQKCHQIRSMMWGNFELKQVLVSVPVWASSCNMNR